MVADKETIAGVGGRGTMGLPTACNLGRAGFGIRAWNRSPDKAQPLADDGVQVLDSPAKAAQGADVILTMLADADAVLESMQQALSTEPAGEAVWLQMSTIGESGTES